MFDALMHADWSAHDEKKWMAAAYRTIEGWLVVGPYLVPSARELIEEFFSRHTVLAGFDFPIGLPAAFGIMMGFKDFPEALMEFGTGKWKDFFAVADKPEDISVTRPFYPRTSQPGSRRDHLVSALGLNAADKLLRICERKTADRRGACPLFWTLGANQVGKAAIDGWQSVLRPALVRGARLWPFTGSLYGLSRSAGCVLCETYPQEAYAHLGVRFPRGTGKRTQEGRRSAGATMLSWALKNGVTFTDDLQEKLISGFGQSETGEDLFDGVAGLLSMIEVVDGRRDEGRPPAEDVWEGWILGPRGPAIWHRGSDDGQSRC